MTARDTTAMLHGLIRLRHETGRGEWAVFEEFQPGTGTSAYSGRRWDVLAVHCWGSSKGHRICYEVKASRSDWLKELSDPGKRDFARRICHQCWVATVPGIVKVEELPEGWGLLVAHGSALRTERAASQRDTVETPDAFVAALARRGCEDGETQPKPAPRGAWRFAGRDVPEADLVQVCKEILAVDHGAQVEAGVKRRTVEIEARVKRLEAMERVLIEEMGGEPSEWALRRRLQRGGGMVPADVALELESLARKIRGGR